MHRPFISSKYYSMSMASSAYYNQLLLARYGHGDMSPFRGSLVSVPSRILGEGGVYTAYWRCTSGSAVPLGHFGEKLLFSFSSFLVVTDKEKQSSSQSRLEQRVCLSGTVWDSPRSTSVVTPLLNQIAGDLTITEDQMLRCRSEPFTNPHGRRRRN